MAETKLVLNEWTERQASPFITPFSNTELRKN